mmetsp:Transcript_14686/g.34042  ORF Transcript_14686/g.34042 Transcript_14686/m.34042 type:complete len:270 (-) Transcript_14686:69-878(-)
MHLVREQPHLVSAEALQIALHGADLPRQRPVHRLLVLRRERLPQPVSHLRRPLEVLRFDQPLHLALQLFWRGVLGCPGLVCSLLIAQLPDALADFLLEPHHVEVLEERGEEVMRAECLLLRDDHLTLDPGGPRKVLILHGCVERRTQLLNRILERRIFDPPRQPHLLAFVQRLALDRLEVRLLHPRHRLLHARGLHVLLAPHRLVHQTNQREILELGRRDAPGRSILQRRIVLLSTIRIPVPAVLVLPLVVAVLSVVTDRRPDPSAPPR